MEPMPEAAMAPESDEAEQASPEEQAQYDTLVANAREAIFGQMSDAILSRLQGGDVAQAIGEVAAMLTAMLEVSAQQAGAQLSGAVLFHGGAEVVADVAELAEAAGLLEGRAVEDVTAEAFAHGLQAYEQQRGSMPAGPDGGQPPLAGAAPAAPGAPMPPPAATQAAPAAAPAGLLDPNMGGGM